MRVAIVTWCTYTNFGTYLQAYALQNYISSLGYEVKLLDDSSLILRPKSWMYSLLHPIKEQIKCLFKPSYREMIKQDILSKALYKSFRNNDLVIDKQIHPLQDLDKRYEIYVCGSDQIWSPIGFDTDKNKDLYFVSFSKNKKIAYAPSIGVSKIPKEYEYHYKQLLSSFAFLSSRENSGVKELTRITNRQIEHVVDPTLLLSRSQWIDLLDKNGNNTSPKERYILLYLLTYNLSYIQKAINFAKQNNLELKIIHSIGVKMDGLKTVNAGPIEFIELIKNASFIFTDSFHGTIFSIIFEKQFITLKRFKDDDKKSQNSRVYDLLNQLGLDKRLIEEDSLVQEKYDDIDYTIVRNTLNSFIQSSKNYLDRALEKIWKD